MGGSISISGLNGRNADSVELSGNSNLGQFLGTENNLAFAGIGNGSRIRSITSDSGNAGSVKINADRVASSVDRSRTLLEMGVILPSPVQI